MGAVPAPSSRTLLLRLCTQVSVFFRTSPKHKLKIIKVSCASCVHWGQFRAVAMPRGGGGGSWVQAGTSLGRPQVVLPSLGPGQLPQPLGRGERGDLCHTHQRSGQELGVGEHGRKNKKWVASVNRVLWPYSYY